MSALRDQLAAALPDHLRLHEFANGVINLNTVDDRREMTRDDTDAFRAALAEAGYVEAESWIAWQGASWLSGGLFAGVSFRVRPA
jgi:hypothetical protein